MKTSEWIAIGVVVLLLLVGGWFAYSKGYFSNDGAQVAEEQAPGNQAAGTPEPEFKPSQIEIKTETEGVIATGTAQVTLPQLNPVVTMTESGFSPATVTIKKGGTVIFHNSGATPIWPASAKHPTHTVYPTTGGCLGSTFDACKGIEPGKSWAFKFDVAGTWAYHDHLNAARFGKVVVE
jgi:plastocyanin